VQLDQQAVRALTEWLQGEGAVRREHRAVEISVGCEGPGQVGNGHELGLAKPLAVDAKGPC